MIELPNGWSIMQNSENSREYKMYRRRAGDSYATWVGHIWQGCPWPEDGKWRLFSITGAESEFKLQAVFHTWQDVEQNLQPTLAALIVRGEI